MKHEEKFRTNEPIHYYLAQIAQFLVKINCKTSEESRSVMLDEFLLKFKTKKDETPSDEWTEQEKKDYIFNSKLKWGLALGLNTLNE